MPTLSAGIPALDSLPSHARVWVYKSAVAFTPAESAMLRVRGAEFAESWAAHGAQLAAALAVMHDHFVVLAVDENQASASGCSIDSSVQFIKQMERGLDRPLTDRMVVLYQTEDGVRACRALEVEGLLKSGDLTTDTLVFNDLVATVGDLRDHFQVPLKETWLARYC
ncbi:MAG: hypothetical protein ACOH13_08310 [Flavobacteriales bacterium]